MLFFTELGLGPSFFRGGGGIPGGSPGPLFWPKKGVPHFVGYQKPLSLRGVGGGTPPRAISAGAVFGHFLPKKGKKRPKSALSLYRPSGPIGLRGVEAAKEGVEGMVLNVQKHRVAALRLGLCLDRSAS